MSAPSQKSNLKKIRHIILAIVALGVFGVYAYKVYSFREEMTSRREEYSMDFLSKLSVYQNPRPASYHETLGAFDAKDFEKLESLAEKYCAERNDPKKDRDNIRQYFWVLGEWGDVSKREQKIETVKTWRKVYPESVPARIAHAMLLIKSAWDARGSGYADSVSEEQFKIFHERIIARAPEKSPYSIYYKNALAHAVMEFTNDPMACRGALESAGWQIDTRV